MSGLCGLTHNRALQVPARDVRRETDSQELPLGAGTSLRLEMGRDKQSYCRSWHLGCCHPGPVVFYTHFGEEQGGSRALAQQRAELFSEAGVWCQSCWDVPHLPVVQEGHRGAVALVPVVGVAGLWLLAGVALLGLLDRPTQINFYRLTISAAEREGKYNKCEE